MGVRVQGVLAAWKCEPQGLMMANPRGVLIIMGGHWLVRGGGIMEVTRES